jgi:hypothetical protein
MVAGQHHDVLRAVGGQDVLVLIHRIGGAAVPALLVHALLRRQQIDELVHLAFHECPAALQVPQQAVALVLRDDADAADARVDAVAEREIDDAELAPEVHGRLGAAVGQVLEPAAAATGQHQRHAALGQLEVQRRVAGSMGVAERHRAHSSGGRRGHARAGLHRRTHGLAVNYGRALASAGAAAPAACAARAAARIDSGHGLRHRH